MSQRDKIRMNEEELAAFLSETRTMNVSTNGPDGYPHLVAMWYGFLDGELTFWTYRKSQKIRNLERDDKITCLVEAGTAYNELRGVMIKGRGVIIEDKTQVMSVGRSVYERYQGVLNDAAQLILQRMGRKRVAVRIEVEQVVSWDHRKLGG